MTSVTAAIPAGPDAVFGTITDLAGLARWNGAILLGGGGTVDDAIGFLRRGSTRPGGTGRL